MKQVLISLLLLFASSSYSQEINLNDCLNQEITEQVNSGNLNEDAREVIIAMLDAYPDQSEGFIVQQIIVYSVTTGIYLEGENKSGAAVKTIARIVYNALKSKNAHAATHDGQGHCNSGCGRGRLPSK